ncbi:MAG: two-component regulator propeller domain-containing protein [Marinilabilia sp.]
MLKFWIFPFFLLLAGSFIPGLSDLNGQERWNAYYSYKTCFELTETDRFIVGATSLGLIYYHKETASVSVKNKVNGLSDTGISAIGYAPETNTLLTGYTNGNIDLVQGDKVTNIPDLKIENMTGSKQINHFLYHEGMVYCSTDFGILEIDASRDEIASTFILGDEASSLKVYRTLVQEDYIYAATSEGILRADLSKGGLTFYENWDLFSESNGRYCDLEKTSAGIIGMRGDIGQTCELELYNDEGTVSGDAFSNFRSLKVNEEDILVVTDNELFKLDGDLSVSETFEALDTGDEEPYVPRYRDGIVGTDGKLWIADHKGGLMFEQPAGFFNRVLPSGPFTNSVYHTAKAGDDLWVVPGGFGSLHNNAQIPASVSILSEGYWTYFNSTNTEAFEGQKDLINIAVNPLDENNVFVASWGNGVFEFEKNSDEEFVLKNHFTEDNSALQNVPNTSADRYTRIWGLTFDQDGRLYMSNSSVESGIVVFDAKEETWHQYDYEAISLPLKPGEILIDDNGFKWLFVVEGRSHGLFVFDDKGTIANDEDDRYRSSMNPSDDNDERNAGQLLLWDESGEEITPNVLSFAKDKNGYIWVGTDKGVVVQYNPGRIFDVSKPVFSRIKIGREDESGLADYLLEDHKITAVAVDEANRKYLGTEGAGIFLVSEDGTRTINHFDMSNSPLPSNNIFNIDIDDESGEVFFSTDKGLISYMGDAVEGEESFGFVYAYPNPVRPGYDGPVTITGLVDRTNVKITDTAGNLVFETVSLGGKAIWNGKNLWGRKVEAGIYIVFLSSPDGSQTMHTKIAVVR